MTPDDLRAEAEKVLDSLLRYDPISIPPADIDAIVAFAQRVGARERLDTIDTAIMLAENVPLSNTIDPGSIRLDILRVLRGMEAALGDKEAG